MVNRIGNGNSAFFRSSLNQRILLAAKPIWHFLRKSDRPIKSDAVFVFGSDRSVVADRAIELLQKGYAGKILFTGGTTGRFSISESIPEAEGLKKYSLQKGMLEENILVETRSSNTYKNISFGLEVLRQHGISVARLLLVSLPYQQLRQWATFEKFKQSEGHRNIELINCPANYSLDDINDQNTFMVEIERIIGEIDRILKYRRPPSEFIIWVDIPDKVMKAYHQLKRILGK